MLILLSPSKTLDFETHLITKKFSRPELLSYSEKLIALCKQLTINDICDLMKISPKLATLNYQRFQNWQPHFTPENSRPAILAFKGDVYEGLAVNDFSSQDLDFAQQHLRILSGLYGLLRPLDLIQPYRLEMGIKLQNGDNKNLYQFWDNVITQHLKQQLATNDFIINLASNEYFKAVKPQQLHHSIIEPVFLDQSKGHYKVISYYAKKARGLMSRYIIKHQLSQIKDIQSFDLAGYQFVSTLSDNYKWVFRRSEKLAKVHHNSN